MVLFRWKTLKEALEAIKEVNGFPNGVKSVYQEWCLTGMTGVFPSKNVGRANPDFLLQRMR